MSSSNRKVYFYFALLILAALAIAIHLLPGLDSSRLELGIRNGLHFILFAIVAALAYLTPSYPPAGRAIFALAVVIACAVTSEYLQDLSGSKADIYDIFRDIAGASVMLVAMLVFSASNAARHGNIKRLALRAAAIIIAMLVTLPFSYWTVALLSERNLQPIVLDFDSRFAHYRFFPINADVILLGGTGNEDNLWAELSLTKRGRSGLAVQTAAYDWSDKSVLVFDAEVVEGPTSELSVHINDKAHVGHFIDTESGMVSLSKGQREYRVPIRAVLREASRGDTIDNIRQLVILARDKHSGARLRIDNVRLE